MGIGIANCTGGNYPSSHNKMGVSPILVSFHLGWVSTSMIMGERVSPPLSLPRLFVGAKQNIHGATSWATATSSFDIKAFRKCRKVVKLCHLHPDLHLTCHLGNIRQGHIGTPVMPMVPAVCMWLAALALSPS